MTEPCRHERSDAITSFVTAIKDLTVAQALLDSTTRTLARVVALNDKYDAMGQDVPTCELSKAIEGAS